jgi:hypothetical protein
MAIPLESQALQVGISRSRRSDLQRNAGKIYTQRKDVQGIKSRLQRLVPDDEYWTTLSLFIYGECSKSDFDQTMSLCLTSNRARILHNEFIRSIIFNAHFSLTPPPGVVVPSKPLPERVVAQEHVRPMVRSPALCDFSAAELRHLPSAEELARRVALILTDRRFTMDEAAVLLLMSKARQYVSALLRKSTDLIVRDKPCMARIRVIHVKQALRRNNGFATLVSPALFSKISLM